MDSPRKVAPNRRTWGPVGRPRAFSAWFVVCCGWYFSWTVKIVFFASMLSQGFRRPVVDSSLFPNVFAHPATALAGYLVPFLVWPLLIRRSRGSRTLGAALLALASISLLWHVQAYNDMTFVTAFWAALWLMWWAPRSLAPEPSESSRVGARLFAQAIVALCFFAGAVGKMTPEYWNGDVFYHIYFEGRRYFPFENLRRVATTEQLQLLSLCFSRFAIFVEWLVALSVFFPTRLAVGCGLLALAGMTCLAQAQILSVLGSLAGLLIGCLLLRNPRRMVAEAH